MVDRIIQFLTGFLATLIWGLAVYEYYVHDIDPSNFRVLLIIILMMLTFKGDKSK